MNMFEYSSSALDALPLNYVSFGVFTVVVNNIWPWVAVITAAAFSFWRIRTTSFSFKRDHHFHHHQQQQQQQPRIDRNTSGSQVNPAPASITNVEPQADSPSPASITTSIPALPSIFDVDGVTEGTKFTFYYCGENDGGDAEETVVKDWRYDDDNGVSGEERWWERVTIRPRIEDLGWFRYQDLTVINGNVVRLWDDCRRKSEN